MDWHGVAEIRTRTATGHDDNGNPDDSFYTFYFEDYDDDVHDGTIFRWYNKKYWDGDSPLVKRRRDESPMLVFESYSDMDRLDSMFGEHWKPAFKQWFYDNFGFEIKTIN